MFFQPQVFVNICHAPEVPSPPPLPEKLNGFFPVPYVCGRTAYKDLDKSGRPCTVYNVIFHPSAVDPDVSAALRALVVQSAIEGVENNFDGVRLERKSVRFPKIKFKGRLEQLMFRDKISEKEVDVREEVVEDSGVRVPEYKVKYRQNVKDLAGVEADRSRMGGRVQDPCRWVLYTCSMSLCYHVIKLI